MLAASMMVIDEMIKENEKMLMKTVLILTVLTPLERGEHYAKK